MTPSIAVIALAQLISWGTLYYGITFLAQPIHASHGWLLPQIFGAYSAGLLVSALLTLYVARLINHFGGRIIMTLGSLLAGISFCILAYSESLVVFYLGWFCAGAAMSLTLYEAAFSTIKEFTGDKFRRSVTFVTLFGALASTVFWPISFYANQWWSWQSVFMIFAGLHIFVCLPLHWWFLPKHIKRIEMPEISYSTSASHKKQRKKIILLAVAFAAQSFIAAAITAHIGHIAKVSHISDELTIFAVSLIGPMQLIGRVLEFIYGRNVRLFYTGMGTLMIQTGCLLLLFFLEAQSWLIILFALSFGMANGLMTIIRALAPSEWFAEINYARVLGLLSITALLMRACGPALTAVFIDIWGLAATFTTLIFIAFFSLSCFYLGIRK